MKKSSLLVLSLLFVLSLSVYVSYIPSFLPSSPLSLFNIILSSQVYGSLRNPLAMPGSIIWGTTQAHGIILVLQ